MPLPAEPEVLQCDFTESAEGVVGSPVEMTTTSAKTYQVDLDQEMLNTLSPEDREILKELDMDGSGKVDLTEILGLLRHHRDNKAHMGKMFKTFFVIVVALVLLLGVNTAATFVVVEMAKENKVKGKALVSAATGKTVETGNSDMGVDADGKLLPKKKGSRLLAAKNGPIKTTPSLKSVELASSLPDKTLMGLDEITVYSDKGHTLQIKVHGFSRVPVLNSRCGNIVHFYTAWKGRITLDSTDMSFDEATAKEFKNAGFSLAVGGMGGRRLAKKSKSDGFFKNMEGLKKSGKWKCAGVPLPTMSETNQRKESLYLPCGTKARAKTIPDLCDSRYGGLVLGAAALEKKHAMATKSKTANVRALLGKKSADVIYVKTRTTTLRSAGYQVSFETLPAHSGQEEITIFDRKTKASVQFQIISGEARSHCKVEKVDTTSKSLDKAKADKSVDTDMHFEFLETVEEEGKTLRHFRMMTSEGFKTYMGAGGTKSKDTYTEYWDIADTLTPYRILSGDGSLTVFESLTPNCTDDQVKLALAKRTDTPIADLMKCSEAEKGNQKGRPLMDGPYLDIVTNDAGWYIKSVFGTKEKMEATAKDMDDTSEKAKFARYLKKTLDQMAMPDYCYEECKSSVDKYKAEVSEGADTCKTGSLSSLLKCLAASAISKCQSSEFATNYRQECKNDTAATSRRLLDEDEDREVPEALVPVRALPDGTTEADLSKGPPSLQATLSKHFGKEVGSSMRLLLNLTNGHKDAIVESPTESRRLFSTTCNSKGGRVTFMGDGWCMKFEFKPKGFSLMIKWGNVGGYMGLAIGCSACVNILEFFGIPPPLQVNFCVGGEISVSGARSCPYIGITISGKVYWRFEVVAAFWILTITIAALEIGIFGAISYFDKETSCWWVCGEGRRRRRWWSGRRRNWRACNYRKECDLKVGAYAELQFTLFKARLEAVYWVRHKCLTLSVGFYIYEFWKLFWGKWRKVYYTEVMRYQF